MSDVTFLGWVPNTALPPYYRAAAVSVIPSLEEGFGIPAAEAMGCEVPVVASDAGGLPEVVEHGVTGLVVPRGDSPALAAGDRIDCWTTRTGGVAMGARRPRARAPAVRLGSVGGAVRATLSRRRRPGRAVTDRLFVFRWDVDHRVCVTDGIPRIRAVCRDFGVPNTFFVNMGRSTNLREWLGKGMARSKAKLADRECGASHPEDRVAAVSARDRPVTPGGTLVHSRCFNALQAEGHELGLHGGMDHVVWSRRFHELPDSTLEGRRGGVLRTLRPTLRKARRVLLARLLLRRAGHAAARPAGLRLQRRRDRRRAASGHGRRPRRCGTGPFR